MPMMSGYQAQDVGCDHNLVTDICSQQRLLRQWSEIFLRNLAHEPFVIGTISMHASLSALSSLHKKRAERLPAERCEVVAGRHEVPQNAVVLWGVHH